jgi:type IV pilus assembly protein PilQ
MKTLISIVGLLLLLNSQILSQNYVERQFKDVNPDELVTLSANLPFNQAIALLSKVSESSTGKRIVSTVDLTTPIGIEIESMAYDKALLIIVQYAGLMYEVKEDVIIIKRHEATDTEKTPETYASVDTREVKISAVFFEMNVSEAKKRGIDWTLLFSQKGLDFGSDLLGENKQVTTSTTQTQTQEANFSVNGSTNFDLGGFFGEATSVFRFFESEELGEIIANPSITVRDRNVGKIQVGSDFSIKQKDFAGNTVEKFYPTGTIIEVTPFIYTEDSVSYMLLNIAVERSSFLANEITSEIRKTNASTQVLMLNGEETVLGGLFINEETTTRNGIPFLKDLPWWVLGIRYLTGSDEKNVTKKELIILIKAELVPSLKDRISGVKENNPLKTELEQGRERIKYYQLQETSKKEE